MAIEVKIVLGVGILQLRRQVAIAGLHRVADRGGHVKARAVGPFDTLNVLVQTTSVSAGGKIKVTVLVEHRAVLQVTIETYRFGFVAHGQAARLIRQHTVEGDLRQAVVRRDLRDGRRLVGMHVQPRGVAVAAVGQGTLLVEEVLVLDADLVRLQVLEVERVADVGVVHLGHQALVQATLVLPVDHVALVFVVGLVLALVALVVEVGAAELAFARRRQVAELAFHQQATLGHVARVQRGVVVGRQVEVVRGDQHEASVAAGAERRRQEAGLAAVVDREVDVRCVEHREILDPQRDVGGGTEPGRRVEGDVVALELPGVAARFAGGVRTVLEADDGVLTALGVQGTAANVRLVHHVFGVVDLGFASVELDLRLVTDDQRAVVADLDVALELATVLGLVQVGLVGLGLHAALAHDHVTGQGRNLLLLLVLGYLGIDVGRRLVLGRGVSHAGA